MRSTNREMNAFVQIAYHNNISSQSCVLSLQFLVFCNPNLYNRVCFHIKCLKCTINSYIREDGPSDVS